MVIVLTLKGSIKELLILVVHLIIAMFIFAILISYAELNSWFNVGIPDVNYGNVIFLYRIFF